MTLRAVVLVEGSGVALAGLRRFFGWRSGRKAHYAELLVDAWEPDGVPEALAALLAGL